jgi:hypothetical protein
MRRRNDDNRTTRRTRAHRIADLSRHHFEGFVLRCGHTVEGFVNDYGYDLSLYTYDYSKGEDGEYENEVIWIQLKATDNLVVRADEQTFVHRLRREHTNLWRDSLLPVILVVYDARNEMAYWLDVQEFLASDQGRLLEGQASITVHIPMTNVVNEDAIEQFRRMKNERSRYYRGVKNADDQNVS